MRKWDYILLSILGTAAALLYFGKIEIGVLGIEEKKTFRLCNIFKRKDVSSAWWTGLISVRYKIGR